MKRAVWLIEAGLSIILSIPLAVLPLQWALRAGEVLGLLLFYLWGSRRRIAIENLGKTVSVHAIIITQPVETIIRNNFKNLGRSLAEVIKIYYGLGQKIFDVVHIEGIEHLDVARAKGKGVLLITGHCGNWELLALSSSARHSPISIVARPVNNPYINTFVKRARKKYGNRVIDKKGALKPVMQGLKRNECIGILMDQAVIPEEGYVIDFLGRGAWTTKMPALIARKTGAAVIPAFIHRENDGHRIRLYPEIELSADNDKEKALIADTERFSGFIEGYIGEHPAEWLWIHRRWKRVNN
ncbi:MAG: lipid biosynthesis acyltransferase [Nitrospirae bacterium]|jgi:KDO2-lipid IV(A) lauroyltransferase|nr:lipid biosynthesis acyltransferase [Nitrospirota bacterium]